MTSSPAEGLPVVEFFTLPVRVWAEARVVRRIATETTCQRGRIRVQANSGSLDSAAAALRAPATPLGMTVLAWDKCRVPFVVSIMASLFLAARRLWLLVWRFRPGGWRPRPAGKLLGIDSRCRAFSRL